MGVLVAVKVLAPTIQTVGKLTLPGNGCFDFLWNLSAFVCPWLCECRTQSIASASMPAPAAALAVAAAACTCTYGGSVVGRGSRGQAGSCETRPRTVLFGVRGTQKTLPALQGLMAHVNRYRSSCSAASGGWDAFRVRGYCHFSVGAGLEQLLNGISVEEGKWLVAFATLSGWWLSQDIELVSQAAALLHTMVAY